MHNDSCWENVVSLGSYCLDFVKSGGVWVYTLERKESYEAEGFQGRCGTWTLHHPWRKKQESPEKCGPGRG